MATPLIVRALFSVIGVLASATTAAAHGISAGDQLRMAESGYLQFIELGASHMITGYDHLLFLFGVVFFLKNVKDIVKFVTAFTLGHSITLIMATFFHVTANYFFIDAIIALSVCYKGFDNLQGFQRYFGITSPNLLSAVFIFGLIHGFGLSTRLQQLPLGNDSWATLQRIIAFNIGVEIGQVTALVAMVALLSFWRNRPSFARFGIVANRAIIAAGLALFFYQAHGLLHTIQLGDLPFDKQNHTHTHEDMAIEAEQKETPHDNL